MSSTKQFPFEKARRITPEELKAYRKAIEKKTGKKLPKRVGRPPKKKKEKYIPISLRLHPRILSWLKREAKKRAVPYQTIINQELVKAAGKAITAR